MNRIAWGDEGVYRIEEVRPAVGWHGIPNADVNVELSPELVKRAKKALAEFDEVQNLLRKHYEDYTDAREEAQKPSMVSGGAIGPSLTFVARRDPATGVITTDWIQE